MRYGVLLLSKSIPTILPDYWNADDWKPATRDLIDYKVVRYITEITEEQINALDYHFYSEKDFNDWLISTDVIPVLKVSKQISLSVSDPGFTRKATISKLSIDLLHNRMNATIDVKIFNGEVEQKEYAKQKHFVIDGEEYHLFLSQINIANALEIALSDFIEQKDSEALI